MNNLPAKKTTSELSKSMKDLVEAQTGKILDLVPNIIDQYAHDIKIAGDLLNHIDGDNLNCPSPVLTDARTINDFLKRVDIIKFTLLKAAGLVAPVANNTHVQQVFNQNNVNILDPALFSALGGFLDLDDGNNEPIGNPDRTDRDDVIEVESIEVNG